MQYLAYLSFQDFIIITQKTSDTVCIIQTKFLFVKIRMIKNL